MRKFKRTTNHSTFDRPTVTEHFVTELPLEDQVRVGIEKGVLETATFRTTSGFTITYEPV